MYYKEFFKNHQLPLVPDKYIIVNAFNVFTFNLILSLQKTLKITKTF